MKMSGNFNKQTAKLITLLFLVVYVPLNYGLPSPASDDEMVHNNNYDTIRMDDHEPAESMHYQNFEEFFNADTVKDDAMDEMEMDESRISRAVRQPQPLNDREKHLRRRLENLDVQRERRIQRSLVKGVAKPRIHAHDWEKFDYDLLFNHK